MVLLLAVVILLTFVRHDLVDDEHDPRFAMELEEGLGCPGLREVIRCR
jgi:hypothetical protein